MNNAQIGNITGDFIGNYASGSSGARGGAIYNRGGTISILAGDRNVLFSGNRVSSSDKANAQGGAIYNDWSNNGSTVNLYVAAGHSITFAGDANDANTDSIYNDGTLNINDTENNYTGTVNLANVDGDDNYGTMNINGGTVNGKGDIKQNTLNISGGTLAVTGTLNVNNITFTLPTGVVDNSVIINATNAVSLSGVTVNVYLNSEEPDSITLISKVADSGTYNVYSGNSGTDANDDYEVKVENSALVLKSLQSVWYTVGDEKHKFLPLAEAQSINDTSGNAVVLHRGAGDNNEYKGINITGALTVGAETETGKSFLVSGDLTANGGVTVATKNTLNVAASNLKSAVTNNGTVNLGEGTLASGNTITGGTLNITGDVTANAVLSAENMNVEQEATLTISADNLQITNGLINTGKTILKGGTLSCDITTTKQTYSDLEIEGEVLNNAEITQNGIRIRGSGTSFTTDADKIHTGQVDMLGGAVLNLTGGTIDFNITNEENTTAKIVENVTVGMSSSGRVGNLQVDGTLDMNGQTNKVTNLDITATGTLNLKNNAYETVVFENLTVAEGAKVNFDAKFTEAGDKISATNGSGKLALGSIGVKDDFVGNVGDTTTITFLTNGAANITLTGSAETVFGAYKYIFEPGTDSGTLKVTKENGFSLHEIVANSKTGAGTVSNYSLKENYDVTENLGTLTRVDEDTPRSLVINGNNHTFDGKTTNAIGVNDGDTLGFKDVTVQGFSDNVAVNNAGTVELDGVTLKSGITGSGTTKIVGNTTLEAKVNQGMTVDTDKTLTTSADNLGGDVTNGGTVNLGAGTLTTGNTITGGTVNIIGDVTANAGDIAGNTNTVAENKTLTFNGGTLTKDITGDGTTEFNNTVSVANDVNLGTNINNVNGTLDVVEHITASNINFQSGSTLKVDGTKITETAAITDITSATVASGAKLYVSNAVKDTTYKILNGSGINVSSWTTDGDMGEGFRASYGLVVDTDNTTTAGTGLSEFHIQFKEDPVATGSSDIGNIIANLPAGSEAKVWIDNISASQPDMQTQGNTINTVANIGSLANVQGGMNAMSSFTSNSIASNIGSESRPMLGNRGQVSGVRESGGLRNVAVNAKDASKIETVEQGKASEVMPTQYEEQKYGKEVWASFIHSKTKIEGMKTGHLEQDSTLQYNGTVVGVDLWSGRHGFGGVALTYGNGNFHSSQMVSNVKNDADYYGINIYNRQDVGKFSFQYDAGFTYAKNDVTMSTMGAEDVTAKPKVRAYSAGIKVEEPIKVGRATEVVPFAGARYTFVKSKEYQNSLGLGYDVDNQHFVKIDEGDYSAVCTGFGAIFVEMAENGGRNGFSLKR